MGEYKIFDFSFRRYIKVIIIQMFRRWHLKKVSLKIDQFVGREHKKKHHPFGKL